MKTGTPVSLCLAVVAGFALGMELHPFPARADARPAEPMPTVFITSFSAQEITGIVASRQLEGRQIVGFSCISGAPKGGECYVASVK